MLVRLGLFCTIVENLPERLCQVVNDQSKVIICNFGSIVTLGLVLGSINLSPSADAIAITNLHW